MAMERKAAGTLARKCCCDNIINGTKNLLPHLCARICSRHDELNQKAIINVATGSLSSQVHGYTCHVQLQVSYTAQAHAGQSSP